MVDREIRAPGCEDLRTALEQVRRQGIQRPPAPVSDTRQAGRSARPYARYDVDLPSTDVVPLLLKDGVAVRAGSEFGPSGHRHLRLSFAADLDTLDEGITRLTASLNRLRAERGTGCCP
ncbi:hypothetical protein [Streptomyces sp. RB17]|uniref:hypothetical protein n=1 Tax=Streptomyces sp. RB17 TaxID=2585197 RepID=UPI001295EA26